MTVYEHVSVSHELSSSESEEAEESVEATLRVLAALKSVQNNIDVPNSPEASQKSSTDQSIVDNNSQASKKSSGGNSVAKSSASNKSKTESLSSGVKNKPGQYPLGVAPLQPSNVRVVGVVPQETNYDSPPRKKLGGFFSCCFRANEQVITSNSREESRASKAKSSQTRKEKLVYAKTTEDIEQEQQEQEEPVELTPYERAMIERLRELLSLDTSLPTLPTHIQVAARAQSPISLDITDSMIANTFSIDTKELQSVLNGEQGLSLGDLASRPGSLRSKKSLHSQANNKSRTSQSDSSKEMAPTTYLPPILAREQSAKKDTSLSRTGSATSSLKKTKSQNKLEAGEPKSLRANSSGLQKGSNASQRSNHSQTRQEQEIANVKLQKTPSNGSKASKSSSRSRSSQNASSVASQQNSVSNQTITFIPSKGGGKTWLFTSGKGLPPKPEKNISKNTQGEIVGLKKSSSKVGSVSANSKKSTATRGRIKLFESSNNNIKTAPSTKSSSSMSAMPDVPMCKSSDEVSIKRSMSSKSTSTASVGLVSKQPSLHYSTSTVSSKRGHVDHQSSHSDENQIDDSRQETEEPRFLPPRPEVERKRKDPMDTIVAVTSQRDELEDFDDDDGGIECIYQLDDENTHDDHPELQVAHSEEPHGNPKFGLTTPHMRRATSEIVRMGPVQPIIRRSLSRESSTILGEAILDNNSQVESDPVTQTASELLVKDTKDIRDDISDLGMLSPKRSAQEEKENVASGHQQTDGTVVEASEPRKMDVLEMFSGGFFCLRGGPEATNAVI